MAIKIRPYDSWHDKSSRSGVRLDLKKLHALYDDLEPVFSKHDVWDYLNKFRGLTEVSEQTAKKYVAKMLTFGWVEVEKEHNPGEKGDFRIYKKVGK